jgi:hypothetical protein
MVMSYAELDAVYDQTCEVYKKVMACHNPFKLRELKDKWERLAEQYRQESAIREAYLDGYLDGVERNPRR